MSLMRRSIYMFFQPFFAVALLLTIAGCANTGYPENPGVVRMAPDTVQAVPDFVRNLPKSATGNMSEYIVFGRRYRVMDSAADFTEQGTASWYGEKFHGRKTSSGEIYDMNAMTAAHKHLPLPTYVRVTNLDNNNSVVVKVNDRGPFVGKRIIDLSFAAAMELGMTEQGTANVYLEALSTHLVAENDNKSNRGVVQSFENNTGDTSVAAPEPIEPALAVVPLQDAAAVINQFETEVAPTAKGELALNADILSKIDRDDEGFKELGATADTAVINAPVVEQPAEVQEAVSVEQPVADNSSFATENNTEENYVIQLGAFGHAPNAEALLDEVIFKTGMKAFIEKDESLELYRVKLGPFVKGNNLDTAMVELAGIGIDGYAKPASMR